MNTLTRRSATILGVVASLLLGLVAMRAAAAWTAEAAPLADRPPSVESLQAALRQETARSAALREQLNELTGGSRSLSEALSVAQAQIDADAGEAAALRADLATARDRLAALEASIAAAGATRTVTVVGGAPATTSVRSSGDEHEDEDDEEHEDDEHQDGDD
jgi:hypothetical protein